MNWEAQHHVAGILWKKFRPAQEMARALGGQLNITVYDELLWFLPEGVGNKEGHDAIMDVMTAEVPEVAPGFRPSVSEVLRGDNWYDLEKVEI